MSRKIILQKNDNLKVLGLDCSSSTIGWGLVDDKLNLLAHGHIKPKKSKYSLMERLDDVFIKIDELVSELKPDVVAVEDILLKFTKGRTTAKTITILASFNRVASLSAYKQCSKLVFLSVQEIRKLIKNHYQIDKKIEKEEVVDIVIKYLYNDFDIKLNRNKKMAVENTDEADGIFVAWGYIIKNMEK